MNSQTASTPHETQVHTVLLGLRKAAYAMLDRGRGRGGSGRFLRQTCGSKLSCTNQSAESWQLLSFSVRAARDVTAATLAGAVEAHRISQQCDQEQREAQQRREETHQPGHDAAASSNASSAMLNLRQAAQLQAQIFLCMMHKAGVPSLQDCLRTLAGAAQHMLDQSAWQVSECGQYQ